MQGLERPLMSRDAVAFRWRMELAQYVKELRVNAGLTQSELCELLGLDNPQFISGIERGKVSIPPERVGDFAKALGVPREEFAQNILRWTNPWMYAELFGADSRLKSEL